MHLQSYHTNKIHSIKQNIFKTFLTMYKYNHKIIYLPIKRKFTVPTTEFTDAYNSLRIVTYIVLRNTINTNTWFTISPL